VKNTLATVQALLGATARSSTSIEEFYHSFAARVVALGRTHTLLTEDYWQAASVREMLTTELGPYATGAESRVVLNGPDVQLYGDLAVPLGMAIHELATNAAKHGSLSLPEGRVHVTWDVLDREGAQTLVLDWAEMDGPTVERPRRRGFGTTLIQRVLTTQCNADIQYEFDPAGVRFHLEAPLLEDRLVPDY
jgi:two-component sensor histidine kinase